MVIIGFLVPYFCCQRAGRTRSAVTVVGAFVVVADGAAVHLLAADVLAGGNRIEARLPLDAEFRQALFVARAALDDADVVVASTTRTCG